MKILQLSVILIFLFSWTSHLISALCWKMETVVLRQRAEKDNSSFVLVAKRIHFKLGQTKQRIYINYGIHHKQMIPLPFSMSLVISPKISLVLALLSQILKKLTNLQK